MSQVSRFLIFCSTSISLLASLVAGRRPQWTAGADKQGMYSIIPIHLNIKSAPASPGRSRVGPAFYVFSFLDCDPCIVVEGFSNISANTTHAGNGSGLRIADGLLHGDLKPEVKI
jgi:hypothetical protein